VITLKKHGKGQGSLFRQEVSKTFAYNSLELWKRQKPEEYEKLSLQFNDSFTRTRKCINSYVMHGRDRNRLFKCLAMRYWGEVKQLSRSAKSAERLGMVDFGKKQAWQDEAASIYATVQQKGLEPVKASLAKEYRLAKTEYHSALKASKSCSVFSPRRRAANKRRKRAAARFRAQIEMTKKINLVQSFFY